MEVNSLASIDSYAPRRAIQRVGTVFTYVVYTKAGFETQCNKHRTTDRIAFVARAGFLPHKYDNRTTSNITPQARHEQPA